MTSQVKFRLSTYRTKHWLKKDIRNVSPKKYHGINVGRIKQNSSFISTKFLERTESKGWKRAECERELLLCEMYANMAECTNRFH